jgi:hypothetical protein
VAKITLLHWNIQIFSEGKTKKPNAAALINYIAWVVGQSQANIISILEIRNNAVDTVVNRLIPAIDFVNGEEDPENTRWKSVKVDSEWNNEAYVVLYQKGNNFKPLLFGGKPICNLTDQADVTEKEGSLEFNTNGAKYGGRMPFYIAFETDAEKKFTIVAIHLMYGDTLPIRESGLENVGQVAQNKKILYKGKATPLEASLTAGDFNVDYNSGHPGAYLNLLDLPSEPATSELTTLIQYIPIEPPKTSYDYRVNAYDNVFLYKPKDPPDKVDGAVLDLIDDSTEEPKGSGLLSDPIGAFVRDGIRDKEEIQNIPPEDYEDSFRIVKRAISDHLPVVLTFEL